MTKLKVLSLFAGIGGFDLGLERTGGFETVAFCEIEKFPRRVLAKHWPGIPIYEDVRTLTADALRRDGIAVDVICGGFPCQDLSFAGKRAGLEGARSGLWGEYGRIIGEVRPRFVLIENVPGLLSLGMETVLGDLSALGYDAIWDCIPASAVGAPHRRDRVWIIAHLADAGVGRCREPNGGEVEHPGRAETVGASHASDAYGQGQHDGALDAEMGRAPEPVADADEQRSHGNWTRSARRNESANGSEGMGNTDCASENAYASKSAPRRAIGEPSWWQLEPDVGRVAHGVPARVDRLKSLGNAVVPKIPEMIGRAILQAERVNA